MLPSRAFDSPAQYDRNRAALRGLRSQRRGAIARDSTHASRNWPTTASPPIRFRYYVVLPLGRVADMWLRPRVENLPIDLDWWVYKHHHVETRFSWFYAGLNALYLLLGHRGLCLRPRLWRGCWPIFVLRSALLATIEAPEARYTLECFPILFALGGIAIWRCAMSRQTSRAA